MSDINTILSRLDRLPRDVWRRKNATSGQTAAWHNRRGDLLAVGLTSRVSGNQISAATAILNAQEKATLALAEAQATRAAVEALAEGLQIDGLVDKVKAAAREGAAQGAASVTAADVAGLLEVRAIEEALTEKPDESEDD